jgi:hypothetical protein
VVTCLPVVQEALPGFTDEGTYRLAREAMLALPIVEFPLREEVVVEAAGLYRAARRRGLTVRSSVDCFIATCAVRHDLEVLHRDRDRKNHGCDNVSPRQSVTFRSRIA